MILFLSDLHLGQGDVAVQRASEADLIACLQSYEDRVEALYLVGDVFDQYIEYATLIPKGFVRFQGLLAAWTDRGVPVTYLVGNHDPWHRDYFQLELGVRVVLDSLVESLYTSRVYITHGDGLTGAEGLYRWLKPVLRHRVPVWLYRTLLPGDSGFRLARWINQHLGDDALDEQLVASLRRHAHARLAETAADVVVMGHSHQAELDAGAHGLYLNTGSWHHARTFDAVERELPHRS